MDYSTDNNIIAIAEQSRQGFKYTIAGVRTRGWLKFNIRRYSYLWVVATNDGVNINTLDGRRYDVTE